MPVLFKRIALLVFCSLLLVACGKEEEAGPQVIKAGVGIPNCVEIGMTLAQIGKRNPDMEVTRNYPPNTQFWEKLFKKPRFFLVSLPSRGAAFSVSKKRDPVTFIHFLSHRLPRSVLRNVANEVLFEPGKVVLREDVIKAFGEPEHSIPGGSHPVALLNQGESASFTNFGLENVVYPRRGVHITLTSGVVTSFSIQQKFGGTNAPARP